MSVVQRFRRHHTSGTCAAASPLTSSGGGWRIAATTPRSSATSPTSTTRSCTRQPTHGSRGGRGPRSRNAASAKRTRALGCLPPTYEPRATGHITEMIELTQRLIDSEHAYPAAGDVYFGVRSFPDYGSLSRQDPAATMHENDPHKDDRKREPADFALWKRPTPGEPATASWPTPWGRARPGWHLECSAMSTRYLNTAAHT